MALDPALLELLACPLDKGQLIYVESESILYNPRQRRRYEIRDDIPVMLPEESVVVDDAEHARLTGLFAELGLTPAELTPDGAAVVDDPTDRTPASDDPAETDPH